MEVAEAEFKRMLIGMLPRLRRFAHALARDADAGEDLAQSAAAHALKQRALYTPGLRFDAWLFQLTRNLWIDQLRRRRARPEITDTEAAMRAADARSFTSAPSTEQHALAARAMKAFRELPEALRETAALVMIEGFTYQETATTLGVPIGTVMSRVARARAAIARALFGEDTREQDGRERYDH
jgi:RNA polymerase sigma-70 factor (ECF subfamily)